jgi:nitrogen fixation protein NifB
MSNTEYPTKLRAAVSSETGRLVDSHFGRAVVFRIYEVSDTEIRLLETREIDAWEPGAGGESTRLTSRVEAIADCDLLVTSRVGQHAAEPLKARGIFAFEFPYQIDKGLRDAFAQWKGAGLKPKHG